MSVYIVKAKKTTLKSPLTATASQVKLSSLVDINDVALTLADFGEWFVLVVKDGSKVEMIKCTGITQNADGSATVTVASSGRGLSPKQPYAGGSTGKTFNQGEVIVTNDPLTVTTWFLNNEHTWQEEQTFTLPPQISADATTANQAVRYSQLQAAVLGTLTNAPLVFPGTAGETLAVDTVVRLNPADGEWYKADGDSTSTSENVLLGITKGAGVDGGAIANGVTIMGKHTASSALFTANQIHYLSDTAGEFSTSAGTNEVSLGAATSTTEIFFLPRFNQQVTDEVLAALNNADGTPSAANPFVLESNANLQSLIFGDGSDGDVVISTNTTLTRDMYYDDLTINDGIVLSTGGYVVYVKGTLTQLGTGVIDNSGGDGGNGGNGGNGGSGANGTAGAAGAAGAGGAGGTLVAGADGAAGGAGGAGAATTGSNGVAGSQASAVSNSIGSNGVTGSGTGGQGGDASAGVSSGGGYGSAQTITASKKKVTDAMQASTLGCFVSGTFTPFYGSAGNAGAGGAGGGGGNNNGTGGDGRGGGGGGGGGAGGNGGFVVVFARTIVNTANALFQSNGGDGGNGGNGGDGSSTGTQFGCGGGGGGALGNAGNGGLIIVVYKTKTTTLANSVSAGTPGSNGSGGAGLNGGSNGQAGQGVAGTAIAGEFIEIAI